MQQVLGKDWDLLPTALKAHHQSSNHQDIGHLTISYPKLMQPYLTLMRWVGVMVNRKAEYVPTQVTKTYQMKLLNWQRTLNFNDGSTMQFNSIWIYEKENIINEYVNRFIALRMAVTVKDHKLYYYGKGILIKIGKLKLTIPEVLLLGNSSIIEEAIDETHFKMDFRLNHPLFGELFCYKGIFITNKLVTSH